ncbi:MAG TPA: histidine--tRNA ligase [Candidatus Paceibacterota bacterium]
MANHSFPKKKINKKKQKFFFQSPRGMHDILPRDQIWWEKVLKTGKEIAEFYNFLKIETPIVENADLFIRAVGIDTDIVSKEMFFIKSRGTDNFILRPEGTASIARSYLEHGLSHISQPVKLYYTGPMFRHEQPQAGRYREFHQFGFEIMGAAADPIYDAQVILASFRFIEGLKIKNLTLQINSIGCRVCRPHFKKRLLDYYRRHEKKLCANCRKRLKTNPLRLLDCKSEDCVALKEHAPNLMDNLCNSCNTHFKSVVEYLDELMLPYTLNPFLVRGLDYYNKTVFEIFTEGYNLAIAGGGRYDYLFEMIGGRPTPGMGSALGIERLIEVMKIKNIELTSKNKARVFLMYIGDMAKKRVLKLVEEFRDKGILVRESFGKDLLRKQMQLADKVGADFALILGQKEVYEESIIIRDLTSGMQESVPMKRVVEEVKKRLK